MADDSAPDEGELGVDVDNLYLTETFTDLGAASVRRLTPVRPDGSADAGRPTVFIGETTLMTQVGPLPVSFAIEAVSLEEAFQKFPDGVQAAIERLNERAREMAREEASRIVVPTAVPPDIGGGPPGGRGGKIVLK